MKQAGTFAINNPLNPLYISGCQNAALSVPITIFNHDLPEGASGKTVPNGTAGDLVITSAFPNIPVCLCNDGPVRPPAPSTTAPTSRTTTRYKPRQLLHHPAQDKGSNHARPVKQRAQPQRHKV